MCRAERAFVQIYERDYASLSGAPPRPNKDTFNVATAVKPLYNFGRWKKNGNSTEPGPLVRSAAQAYLMRPTTQCDDPLQHWTINNQEPGLARMGLDYLTIPCM